MRPRGEFTHALGRAAQQGGTVVQLAHRAQVSVPVARYTASRMLDRGELVVLQPGRPAVLVAADAVEHPPAAGSCGPMVVTVAQALDMLDASFWERER